MSFIRFTVTIIADVDDSVFKDQFMSRRVELALYNNGVMLVKQPTDNEVKIGSIRADIQPGGMSQEEYIAKIHAQVHKAHEDEDEGGSGGHNSLN